MAEKSFTLNRGAGDRAKTVNHRAINSLGMNLGTSSSNQLLAGVSRGFNDSLGPC